MRKIIIASFCCLSILFANAQTFIPLWNGDKMPNSRHLHLKDSVANERIYQVGTPGIFAFTTSKAENKGAAVIIIPGGGYARLAYEICGFQFAKWLNTFGVNAFVLSHRLPQSPDVITSYQAPLQDGQRAIRYIRAHAKEYQIDINKIGVMGCSAGGHLAACLSTIKDDWSAIGDTIDKYSFRPNFSVLISPVISMKDEYAHKGSRQNLIGNAPTQALLDKFSCDQQVDGTTPPAFLVHAMDDPAVSCMNSILYFSALKKSGVKNSSLHIFPAGEHNIALRNNPPTTNTWSTDAELWMREIKIIP
jgi:acetyl esterase/lipase